MFIVGFLHLQLGLSFNSVLTIKDINVIKTIEQKPPRDAFILCQYGEKREFPLSSLGPSEEQLQAQLLWRDLGKVL